MDQTKERHTNRSRYHFLRVVLQEKGIWPSIFIISCRNATYSDSNVSPQHCSHPYILNIVFSAWKTKARESKWGQIPLTSALLWNTLWFVTFIQLQTYECWVLLSTKESVQTSCMVPLFPSHVTGQSKQNRSNGTRLSLDTDMWKGKWNVLSVHLSNKTVQHCHQTPSESLQRRDTLDVLPSMARGHPGQWSCATPAQRELRASLKAIQHIIRGLSTAARAGKPKSGFCYPQMRECCGYPRPGFTLTEPGWQVIQPGLRGVVSQ